MRTFVTAAQPRSPDLGEVIKTAVVAALKPEPDLELAGLIGKIVKAGLMEEAAAKELTLNAARALVRGLERDEQVAANRASFWPKSPSASEGEVDLSNGTGFKLPKGDGG